jgi:hypothetical protein
MIILRPNAIQSQHCAQQLEVQSEAVQSQLCLPSNDQVATDLLWQGTKT